MSEAIELHDSEMSSVDLQGSAICIVLSDTYIWADKKGWGQKAFLRLDNVEVIKEPGKYPLTISDGSIISGDEQFDNIVPLPFSEKGRFSLRVTFTNGAQLIIDGDNPTIELVGERRYIEEAGDL